MASLLAPARHQQPARARILLFVAGAVVALLVLSRLPSVRQSASSSGTSQSDSTGAGPGAPRHPVILELFVMSRCPDAHSCESAVEPILKKLGGLVRLKMEYIADISADGKSVMCKHGAEECSGNKQQLCLQHNTPRSKNVDWLYNFVMCQWKEPNSIGTPQLAQSCLQQVGVPQEVADSVMACANGKEGNDRLLASAQTTQTRGVKKSCTMHIDGVHRCIRDGGEWYDCPGGSDAQDFIKSICKAYEDKTGRAPPPECAPTTL